MHSEGREFESRKLQSSMQTHRWTDLKKCKLSPEQIATSGAWAEQEALILCEQVEDGAVKSGPPTTETTDGTSTQIHREAEGR